MFDNIKSPGNSPKVSASDFIARNKQQFPTDILKKIVAKIEIIPERYKRISARAIMGECPPSQAIKAKCLDCVGWELPIENIGKCRAKTCPLHSYRPYQKNEEEIDE